MPPATAPRRILSPREKALAINLDGPPYGTLAEIGAGQEVANWFFRVGAASGTIAKTMSAYDMVFSDSIYGPTKQYVSRDRALHMVEHEYGILVERLGEKRGAESTFFAFANTVRARAWNDQRNECHGWMAIRLQFTPGGEPNDIIVHVRLFDEELTDQQDALGVLGVNFIHAAFYHRDDLKTFVESLLDNLRSGRAEVDLLKFTGPGLADIDNRLCALQLVLSGLTDSACFSADGEVMQASEKFYRKPLLLLRGRFDPVANVHLDMLASAGRHLQRSLADPAAEYIEIMELSMNNLLDTTGNVDPRSFLQRADILQSLGKSVLVSRFAEFHRLGAFLSRSTREPIGIVLGVSLLEELFQEKWYDKLDGGILESFGRLFKNKLKLLVYPESSRHDTGLKTARDITVAPHLRKLFEYLLENKFIEEIIGCEEDGLRYSTSEIRALIDAGDPLWKSLVPPEVVLVLEQ